MPKSSLNRYSWRTIVQVFWRRSCSLDLQENKMFQLRSPENVLSLKLCGSWLVSGAETLVQEHLVSNSSRKDVFLKRWATHTSGRSQLLISAQTVVSQWILHSMVASARICMIGRVRSKHLNLVWTSRLWKQQSTKIRLSCKRSYRSCSKWYSECKVCLWLGKQQWWAIKDPVNELLLGEDCWHGMVRQSHNDGLHSCFNAAFRCVCDSSCGDSLASYGWSRHWICHQA